ncbi:MAG: OB-fold-containig protein, partial [Pseudomonadota bacterium]
SIHGKNLEQGRCHWCSDGRLSLLEAHNLPFAVAIGLLVFIAIMQVTGLGDLFDAADADIDLEVGADFDIDAELDPADAVSASGFMDGLLSLIGLGKVPFLIWLAMLLVVFAGIGVSGQALAQSLLGAPFDALAAGGLAGLAALPINGVLVRPLAAILPKDESSAIHTGNLIRRDAVIQTGTARVGSPARGKVIDQYGQPHFVMVEPHDPGIVLNEGETVLIVRREGETFYAMRYESPLLGPE